MVDEEFADPLAIDFSLLRQDSGCGHPEGLRGELRHDAPLKLVGERGHEDKVAGSVTAGLVAAVVTIGTP